MAVSNVAKSICLGYSREWFLKLKAIEKRRKHTRNLKINRLERFNVYRLFTKYPCLWKSEDLMSTDLLYLQHFLAYFICFSRFWNLKILYNLLKLSVICKTKQNYLPYKFHLTRAWILYFQLLTKNKHNFCASHANPFPELAMSPYKNFTSLPTI